MFLKRLFWGSVSFVWVIPLWWIIDQAHVGGRNEELLFVSLLVCGWASSEGFVRRSFKAGLCATAISGVLSVLIMIVIPFNLAQFLFPTCAFVTTIGLASASWIEDRSLSLALRTLQVGFVLAAGVAVASNPFNIFETPSMWLGVVPQLGAALARRNHPAAAAIDKDTIRFSLSSALLFILLVGGAATAGFLWLGLGPITVQRTAALDALGDEARIALGNWRPGQPRPAEVSRFLVEACRQSKSYQYVEKYLGPSTDFSRGLIVKGWCVDGETNPYVTATIYSNTGVMDHVTGNGFLSDDLFAYSRDQDERRRRALFSIILTSAFPISLLIIAGIERLRKKHPTPSTP